jgi:hypothetical protein
VLGIRDGAIEMEFGIDNSDCRRANILISIEFVTTNSHTDSVWFCFAWAHGADKSRVGNFASCRDLVRRNEKEGVVANDLFILEKIFGDALCTATSLVG